MRKQKKGNVSNVNQDIAAIPYKIAELLGAFIISTNYTEPFVGLMAMNMRPSLVQISALANSKLLL